MKFLTSWKASQTVYPVHADRNALKEPDLVQEHRYTTQSDECNFELDKRLNVLQRFASVTFYY
jgi:hypothetical protein